jgi:hypothetical protein
MLTFCPTSGVKMQTAANLSIANALIARGLTVIPCNPGKQPITPNGFKDASRDPEIIHKWFNGHIGLLVGIPCRKNDFWALDIDNWDAFEEIRKGRPIPPTPAQKTPRGGCHILFTYPQGIEIKNTAGWLADGLDLRSDGYICTGRNYTWLTDHDFTNEIQPAPDWLIEAILQAEERHKATALHQPNQAAPTDQNAVIDAVYRYYLNSARVGSRNHCAYLLGLQLFYADVNKTQAEDIAARFAREVPESSTFTEIEAVRAIRSAYKTPMKRPAWIVRGR